MATDVKQGLYEALCQSSLVNQAWLAWQQKPLPLDDTSHPQSPLPELPCWLLQAAADPGDQALQSQLEAFRRAAGALIHMGFLRMLQQRKNLEIATHVQDRYPQLLFEWFNGKLELKHTLDGLDLDWLACLHLNPGGSSFRLDTYALWQRIDTKPLLQGLADLQPYLQPTKAPADNIADWQGYVYQAVRRGFQSILRGEGLSRSVYELLGKMPNTPFFQAEGQMLRLNTEALPDRLKALCPTAMPERQALAESALYLLVQEARAACDPEGDFTVLFDQVLSMGERQTGLGRLICRALARRHDLGVAIEPPSAGTDAASPLTSGEVKKRLKSRRDDLLQELGIATPHLKGDKALELMLGEILARYLLSLGLHSIGLSQAKRLIFDLFGLHSPREVIPVGRAYLADLDESEAPHQDEDQPDGADAEAQTSGVDAQEDSAQADEAELQHGLLLPGTAPLKSWEASLQKRFAQKVGALPEDNQIRNYYFGRYQEGLRDKVLKDTGRVTNTDQTKKALALCFFFFYKSWERPLLMKDQAEALVREQMAQHAHNNNDTSSITELEEASFFKQALPAVLECVVKAKQLKFGLKQGDAEWIVRFIEVDAESQALLKLNDPTEPVAPPFGYIKAMSALWRLHLSLKQESIQALKQKGDEALQLMELLEGQNEH